MSVRFLSIFRLALHWSCSAGNNPPSQARGRGSGDGDRVDARGNGRFHLGACACDWAGRAVRRCCCCLGRYHREFVSWVRRDLHASDDVRESGRGATRHAEGAILRAGNSPTVCSAASLLAGVPANLFVAPADVRQPCTRAGRATMHRGAVDAARVPKHLERFEHWRRQHCFLRLLVVLLRSGCERSRRGPACGFGRRVFSWLCNQFRAASFGFKSADNSSLGHSNLVAWGGAGWLSGGGE